MISVFICTYNPDYLNLKLTIETVLKQNFEKEWEFYIIDNNSKSPVSEIDYVKQQNIKVVVEKKQGLTAARGCATNISRGDILVFIDDDNLIDSNYLTTVTDLFNDEKLGIVSGSILPKYEVLPGNWFQGFESSIAIKDFSNLEKDVIFKDPQYSEYFPIGAGMSVRREIIEEYYNEHLLSPANYIEGRKGDELSSAEDIDIAYFALSKGYAIGVSPRLKMYHIIPAFRVSYEYILKLSLASMKSTYFVNKKWKPFFKTALFSMFEMPIYKLRLYSLISSLLSFSSKKHALKSKIFNELIKYNDGN
jgi:glycosyltransferase involved in cell wall biosynthesis